MAQVIKDVSELQVRNLENAYLVANQNVKEQKFLIPKDDGEFSLRGRKFTYTAGEPILFESISAEQAENLQVTAARLAVQASGHIYPQSQITQKQLLELYQIDRMPDQDVFTAKSKPKLSYAVLLKEEVMTANGPLNVTKHPPGHVLIESMSGSKIVIDKESFKETYKIIETMRGLNKHLRMDNSAEAALG